MTREPTSVDPQAVVIATGSLAGRLDLQALFPRVPGPRRFELEVGCGKGRFLLQAAARWPERDFLAVEHSRALVRKVRDRVVRAGLRNVRLHHGNARDLVLRLAPESAIARVHVYFPDPWPKRRHAKHRLFAPPLPDGLARILAPEGDLLFATDFDPYFREVVARLAAHPAFVRTTTEEVFAEIPSGGFEAIFRAAAIPIFRARWERRPAP